MEPDVAVTKQQHEQVLYPVVRVRTSKAGGSGTVLYSKGEKGKVRTYILTNHHVIDDAIVVKPIWNPIAGKKVKKEFRAKVTAEYFDYNNLSRFVGADAKEAQIVAYNAEMDLALLELQDREEPAEYVARMIPLNMIPHCHLLDPVLIGGAALGHSPIITSGRINCMDDEIDHHNYWLSDAQIIFGNSGGGVFRFNGLNYEFIGVPARVASSGWSVVEHMGFFIPPDTVYRFLDENDYQFVYDPSMDPAECDRKRDEKHRTMERLLELQFGKAEDDDELE